jgi:hypothetical protein
VTGSELLKTTLECQGHPSLPCLSFIVLHQLSPCFPSISYCDEASQAFLTVMKCDWVSESFRFTSGGMRGFCRFASGGMRGFCRFTSGGMRGFCRFASGGMRGFCRFASGGMRGFCLRLGSKGMHTGARQPRQGVGLGLWGDGSSQIGALHQVTGEK